MRLSFRAKWLAIIFSVCALVELHFITFTSIVCVSVSAENDKFGDFSRGLMQAGYIGWLVWIKRKFDKITNSFHKKLHLTSTVYAHVRCSMCGRFGKNCDFSIVKGFVSTTELFTWVKPQCRYWKQEVKLTASSSNCLEFDILSH